MRVILFILTLWMLSACQSDEADEPEIETKSATGIGLSQAVLQGELKEVGPLKPVQYGFIWSKTPGVTVLSAESKVLLGEAFEGELPFSSPVNGLQQNTNYYYRAFVTNPSLTQFFYGEEQSFKTTQPAEYVRTLTADNITSTSARLRAEILALNELPKVTYGLAWSTTPFTSILQAQTIVLGESSAALAYQHILSGLATQTTYYYRAFISNESGTVLVYGEQQNFTTLN
jgi:hypothetical protein